MRIEIIGTGPQPDLSTDGPRATIAGHLVDCEAEQRDERVIVDLYLEAGTVSREPAGRRIASVEIPPRAYLETDDERQPLPLAPESILLTLWEM